MIFQGITPRSTGKVGDYKVNIMESERGWGSKVEDTYYFDSKQDAAIWCMNYNKKYQSSSSTPDWYMIAEYAGQVN